MTHVDNDNLAFEDGKRQHPVCAKIAVARRSWTFAKRRRDLEAENDD